LLSPSIRALVLGQPGGSGNRASPNEGSIQRAFVFLRAPPGRSAKNGSAPGITMLWGWAERSNAAAKIAPRARKGCRVEPAPQGTAFREGHPGKGWVRPHRWDKNFNVKKNDGVVRKKG
jgi:hypothetical protein